MSRLNQVCLLLVVTALIAIPITEVLAKGRKGKSGNAPRASTHGGRNSGRNFSRGSSLGRSSRNFSQRSGNSEQSRSRSFSSGSSSNRSMSRSQGNRGIRSVEPQSRSGRFNRSAEHFRPQRNIESQNNRSDTGRRKVQRRNFDRPRTVDSNQGRLHPHNDHGQSTRNNRRNLNHAGRGSNHSGGHKHNGHGHKHRRRDRSSFYLGFGLGVPYGWGYQSYSPYFADPYYYGRGFDYGYRSPYVNYDYYGGGSRNVYSYAAPNYVYAPADNPGHVGSPNNVVIGGTEPANATSDHQNDATHYSLNAERSFQSANYTATIRHAQHGLVESPDNGRLHEVLSQALFAEGDYQLAAVALQRAMALTNPDDWGYLVRNYKDYYQGKTYVQQMDRLVQYVKDNPDAAYARFLRGYHYGFLGYNEAARADLRKALNLEKRDEMSKRLLKRFGGVVDEPESVEKVESAVKVVDESENTIEL